MLCVLILYISGGTYSLKSTPNDKIFEKLFMAILFTLTFFARNLLRGNRRRNTFRISFWCQAWDWNPGFSSNKPTHYLLDHGDFNEHLTVTTNKICLRWITHNCSLSIAQKKASVDWSKEMLQKYDRGASKHVYDIMTSVESWIYVYEPDSKQQSTIWVFQDEPKTNKSCSFRKHFQANDGCFFGKNGHVAIVPLGQCRTVNCEWYITICLPVVFQEIKKINCRKRSARQCEFSQIG